MSSSIICRLPSKVMFHRRSYSIEGRIPSKVVFHRMSSSSSELPPLPAGQPPLPVVQMPVAPVKQVHPPADPSPSSSSVPRVSLLNPPYLQSSQSLPPVSLQSSGPEIEVLWERPDSSVSAAAAPSTAATTAGSSTGRTSTAGASTERQQEERLQLVRQQE